MAADDAAFVDQHEAHLDRIGRELGAPQPQCADDYRLRPQDPRRAVHAYGGIEHMQPGPFDDCLLCKLEAVAAAWFEFRQSDLDALLHGYRKDDDE